MVEGNEMVLYFHSDGSVEDWGYKFTCTPTYPHKASSNSNSANRTHWLVKLEFELVQCSAALAAVLVQGLPWQDSLENSHSVWMENPLIR